MTDEIKGTMFSIIERWGFPTLVAIAFGWVLRQDVLLPLVQAHTQFLEQLGETQKDISGAIQEQTRLLYAQFNRERLRPGCPRPTGRTDRHSITTVESRQCP
jgi:hypothetical protein